MHEPETLASSTVRQPNAPPMHHAMPPNEVVDVVYSLHHASAVAAFSSDPSDPFLPHISRISKEYQLSKALYSKLNNTDH